MSGFSRLGVLILWLLAGSPATLARPAPGLAADSLAWYWITFADKAGTQGRLEHPEAYLSPRALQRRQAQGIPIDSFDLPVSRAYLDSLEARGARIRHTSKWLNGATALLPRKQLPAIEGLEFVSGLVRVAPHSPKLYRTTQPERSPPLSGPGSEAPSNQALALLRGDTLHHLGLRGQGMRIAILDGGFQLLDQAPALASLREEGRIVATRDLMLGDSIRAIDTDHGTLVLTQLGGSGPGLYRGAAPEAEYILLRSEIEGVEYRLEECHWVAALELADSLGADVVNASLSYRRFDDAVVDYNWKELDGQTALSSRAAGVGAARGLLLVVSAGNRPPWAARHVPAPADSPHVLAVGALDKKGKLAGFSARGPTVDGRVKPDLVAPGKKVPLPDPAGKGVVHANGTSFSAPTVAGLAACLWQAFPGQRPETIARVLRETASLSDTPDRKLGFGVPDLARAYQKLARIEAGQLPPKGPGG